MKRIIACLAVLFVTACNSSSDPEVIGVSLSASPTSIATGDSSTLSASLIYDDNSTSTLSSADANFSINDDALAAIEGNHLTGLNEGTVTASVSYEGFSDSVTVSIGPVELRAIVLSDENVSLALGQSYTLEIYGEYSDNDVKPLEGGSVQIMDMDVLEFGDSNDALLLNSIAVGATEVRVTYEQLEASLAVEVTDAEITRIVVGIDDSRIAAGESTNVFVTATLTDNSHQNVTSDTEFTTTSEHIEISGSEVIGLSAGDAVIEGELNGLTASVELEITPAIVTGLSLEASTTSLPLGTSSTFHAQAAYSDGDVRNVSSSASWSVDKSDIIELNRQGDINAVGVGETLVSVEYQGYTDSTTVQVTEAELVSITLEPAGEFETFEGATFTPTASGTYTDGSQSTITSAVTWSSSDSDVASISNHSDNPGLIHAKDEGTTTISASLNGQTSGFELTVVEATLVDIEITTQPLDGNNAMKPRIMTVTSSGFSRSMNAYGNSSGLPAGRTLQLYAIGTFENGGLADVTTAVSWSIENTGIAQFTDPAGQPGKVKGRAVGTTSVQVESANGVASTYDLQIAEAVIESIEVSSSDTLEIFVGDSAQLAAEGFFSDNSAVDVTAEASWQSSNVDIATVSNQSATKGKVTALTLGSSTITGSIHGVSDSVRVTVVTYLQGERCSSGFGSPTCNAISFPYAATSTSSISRLPAPSEFEASSPITVTALKEGVTATRVTAQATSAHDCRVAGIAEGDQLSKDQDTELQFLIDRTFGQSRTCVYNVEFDNSDDLTITIQATIATN